MADAADLVTPLGVEAAQQPSSEQLKRTKHKSIKQKLDHARARNPPFQPFSQVLTTTPQQADLTASPSGKTDEQAHTDLLQAPTQAGIIALEGEHSTLYTSLVQ